MPPEGFLSYNEAASILGTRGAAIRALVAQGILSSPNEYRFGLSKLVPAGEVQRFAEQYVSANVLARRFHVPTRWASQYLEQLGVRVLVFSVPGYRALFVPEEIATRVRIPPQQRSRSENRGSHLANSKPNAIYRRNLFLGTPDRKSSPRWP